MPLKFKFKQIFRGGKIPDPQNLYSQLEELQTQIDNGSDPVPPVKEEVKLTKTGLKKAFGDPKDFKTIGIVRNTEGSYLIVSNGKNYTYTALENI